MHITLMLDSNISINKPRSCASLYWFCLFFAICISPFMFRSKSSFSSTLKFIFNTPGPLLLQNNSNDSTTMLWSLLGPGSITLFVICWESIRELLTKKRSILECCNRLIFLHVYCLKSGFAWRQTSLNSNSSTNSCKASDAPDNLSSFWLYQALTYKR